VSTYSASYSERLHGAQARTLEVLPDQTAVGLRALVDRRILGNYLAEDFPSYCTDRYGIDGTDGITIGADLTALVPGSTWPLWQEAHSDAILFDILEYVGDHISLPVEASYHEYFHHYELKFDREAGRQQFRNDVNAILSRGGTVFEMDLKMQIRRSGSPEVQTVLGELRPSTGEAKLDELLETARELYISRRETDRVTAIEKLWDGFERLKTLDDPSDKKRSVNCLLDNIKDSAFRDVVEQEMRLLTQLGNTFQIRHYEIGKHAIPIEGQDYLAARISNLLVLLLAQSGRLRAAS